MQKYSLAYVVNSLNAGGAEKLVMDMSLAIAPLNRITVICLDEPGSWAPKLRANNVPVYCIWRQGGLDATIPLRLARLFKLNRFDIIHAHQYSPWFYCALARNLYANSKLLFEEHGRFYPEILK